MPKFKTSFAMCWLLLATVSLVYAQADAQKAYQDAKTAYQAGNFAEARDLAQKAAQTDAKNPVAFCSLARPRINLARSTTQCPPGSKPWFWPQKSPLPPACWMPCRPSTRRQCRMAFIEMLIAEKFFKPAAQEAKNCSPTRPHPICTGQTAAHAGRVGHRPGQIGRGGTNHHRNPGPISFDHEPIPCKPPCSWAGRKSESAARRPAKELRCSIKPGPNIPQQWQQNPPNMNC